VGRGTKGLVILTFLIAMGVDSVSPEPRELAKVKSVDKYWMETGLKSEDLEELVSDYSCGSSLRYFLACVNAVSNILYRNDKILVRTGETLEVKPLRSSKETTERQLLEPWRKFFLSVSPKNPKLNFLEILRKNLEGAPNKESLIAAGLNGFLSVFKDPHTYIIPVNYFHEVVSKSSPKTRSLGVVVSKTTDNYFIRKVIPHSPAREMGIKKGDFLLAINDMPIEKYTFVKVNELLRSEDSVIKLKIRRDNEIMNVTISRREVELPAVNYEMIQNSKKLAVLNINKFSKGSCDMAENSIKEILSQNPDGIILDLRDNSGGQIEEAACISGLFLGSKRKLFDLHFFDSKRPAESVYSEKELLFSGALAILINRGSASASELLAGSLRDYGRALLVGEPSFGKGSFQEGEIWKHNSKIALFSSRGFYILPSGYSPQMYGLVPDIEVKFMNDMQARESDQYFYALQPPRGPRFAPKKVVAINACGSQDKEADDSQLSRAAQVLFCMQPVAGVANDFNESF
jgi:carboxyl-terminal processing protease